MLRSLKELERYVVNAINGEVGSVVDLLLDDEHWVVRYLVVEIGELPHGRRVLISPRAFKDVDWSTRRFNVSLTVEQVSESPGIETDQPVSRQHERDFDRYYGYAPYWGAAGVWGLGHYPGLMAGAAIFPDPEEDTDPNDDDVHLRSAAEVRGYHIQGIDDQIGHVEDFIADDETWAIRFLVVDTSNWWFGKKVLVAPQWATGVSWEERTVSLSIRRKEVEESPEWNGDMAVREDYEELLRNHYGWPLREGTPGTDVT